MFRNQIMLVDLESLLERPQFEFYQIAVIPVKDCDLALRVGDFADDAHLTKMGIWTTIWSCRKGMRSWRDLSPWNFAGHSDFIRSMSSQPVILFDGVCNLCNGSVQ